MKLSKIKNFDSKIRKSKGSYSNLLKISNAIKLKNGNIKIVGGAVRDLILDQENSKEVDLATDIEPKDVIYCLEKKKIQYIKLGIKFGCITAKINNELIEITSLRKDIKSDGRWPDIKFTKSWLEDSMRRDFTINAIYVDQNGLIYDPQNGIKDLLNKKVLFIGDPCKRIKEDYLRILRFLRFSFVYSGKIDIKSLKICVKYKERIKTLSFERRLKEISKMIILKNFEKNFFTLKKHGFFHEIFETKIYFRNATEMFSIERKLDMISSIRRMKYLFQMRKPNFLKVFSKKDLKRINTFLKIKEYDKDHFQEIIYLKGKELLIDQLIFDASKKKISFHKLKSLVSFIKSYKIPIFPIDGNDIKSLGISRGENVGYLKKKTESWWIGKNFFPTKADCLDYLNSLPASKRR